MISLIDVYRGTGTTPGAIEFLFELIKERMTEPVVNISATMPSMGEHRQFVHRRPYRCWYLIERVSETEHDAVLAGGFIAPRWVGYISATERNEIGIVLKKDARGKGYGTAAVKAFRAKHEPLPAIPSERRGRFIANINPQNAASIALFTGLGGKHISNTYEL